MSPLLYVFNLANKKTKYWSDTLWDRKYDQPETQNDCAISQRGARDGRFCAAVIETGGGTDSARDHGTGTDRVFTPGLVCAASH